MVKVKLNKTHVKPISPN